MKKIDSVWVAGIKSTKGISHEWWIIIVLAAIVLVFYPPNGKSWIDVATESVEERHND